MNVQWSMHPQEVGDGLKNIVEFQVQIKGHNHREFENKWQRRQHWTDEKIATKLTKVNQQPVLLLPARWWPDTLPEFESGGWWQRPQMRVKCRHYRCGFINKSNKCHGCGKQMQTKDKRLDGIVFTNANPQYAGKLDDPQGGNTKMLILQLSTSQMRTKAVFSQATTRSTALQFSASMTRLVSLHLLHATHPPARAPFESQSCGLLSAIPSLERI